MISYINTKITFLSAGFGVATKTNNEPSTKATVASVPPR